MIPPSSAILACVPNRGKSNCRSPRRSSSWELPPLQFPSWPPVREGREVLGGQSLAAWEPNKSEVESPMAAAQVQPHQGFSFSMQRTKCMPCVLLHFTIKTRAKVNINYKRSNIFSIAAAQSFQSWWTLCNSMDSVHEDFPGMSTRVGLALYFIYPSQIFTTSTDPC